MNTPRLSPTEFHELSSSIAAGITRGRVREVIMHDLGLDKDTIRHEAEKMITDLARIHLGNLIKNGDLDKILKREVENLIKAEREKIQAAVGTASTQVSNAIKKEIADLVQNNLKLQLNHNS